MGMLYQRTVKVRVPDAKDERKTLPTWWIKYYQHGRAIRESTGTDNKIKAKRILRAREGDVEHGITINPKMGRITFEDAAADMLNDYRTNGKRSLGDLGIRLTKHLRPAFGGRLLANVTTADLRTYTAARQVAGAANGTINRELATIKRMFSLAMQAGKLQKGPYVPRLREQNVRTGFFEREQFEAVRAHLPEHLRGIVTFAYLTGWRSRSEVLALEWRHVDFVAGTVSLDAAMTKNGEARTFPMITELRAVLEDQQTRADKLKAKGVITPWVFCRRTGAPIQSFYRRFRSACAVAGCPGRIVHDFRRTAVRNLVRAGIPERVAMQLTGHKTRSVFERYNIVSPGDLREAGRKLEASTGTFSGTLTGSATHPTAVTA